jgi:hypothetical protein
MHHCPRLTSCDGVSLVCTSLRLHGFQTPPLAELDYRREPLRPASIFLLTERGWVGVPTYQNIVLSLVILFPVLSPAPALAQNLVRADFCRAQNPELPPCAARQDLGQQLRCRVGVGGFERAAWTP